MTPFEEGRAAAERLIGFSTCPYTFENAKVSQAEFDRDYRPKLNEWFNGWKAHLDAHGLGLNMKPKKQAGKPSGARGRG